MIYDCDPELGPGLIRHETSSGDKIVVSSPSLMAALDIGGRRKDRWCGGGYSCRRCLGGEVKSVHGVRQERLNS